MDILTAADLDILIEAVESWEHKDASGELMMGLVGGLAMRGASVEEKAKYEAEEQSRRSKAEVEKRRRKEQSILLRAKLIQILDAKRASDFTLSAIGER